MCAANGRAAELDCRTGCDRAGQTELGALDDEVHGLEVVGGGKGADGRLVLRRDLGERVTGFDHIADRRPGLCRRLRQHRRAPAAPERRQRRRAGDAVDRKPAGALEADQPGFRRRAEVTVDVEQPEMPRPGEEELERRDVPAVGALDEHAPRVERSPERSELGARSRPQLPGDGQLGGALERAQAFGRHRPGDPVDLAEVHAFRAQRHLQRRDLGIGRARGERRRCGNCGGCDGRDGGETEAHGRTSFAADLQPPSFLYKIPSTADGRGTMSP